MPQYTSTIPPQQEILYRMDELLTITGHGRSTIYKAMAAGEFPRPVALGRQSVAWKKSDIDRWIATRPVANPDRLPALSTIHAMRRVGR